MTNTFTTKTSDKRFEIFGNRDSFGANVSITGKEIPAGYELAGDWEFVKAEAIKLQEKLNCPDVFQKISVGR